VSPADGERRVVLYRKLEELPLIMIAGLANDDILGRWQSRAYQTAFLVALAFVAIGALTAFGVRHAGREAKALQELHAAREHERLLVAEIDHRSRNLLSIIEAQIRQTARHSGNKQELTKKLSGRVHALAGVHDLLSAEKWKEVDVAPSSSARCFHSPLAIRSPSMARASGVAQGGDVACRRAA
jgi:hypothetical protein